VEEKMAMEELNVMLVMGRIIHKIATDASNTSVVKKSQSQNMCLKY
jgi:hypothetical protein